MTKNECGIGMYVKGQYSGIILQVTKKEHSTFQATIIDQAGYCKGTPDQKGKTVGSWPYNLFDRIHYIGETRVGVSVKDLLA